jgi:hypothetical protein
MFKFQIYYKEGVLCFNACYPSAQTPLAALAEFQATQEEAGVFTERVLPTAEGGSALIAPNWYCISVSQCPRTSQCPDSSCESAGINGPIRVM